ncbi:MAG: S49 family peptidase, partial [Planctomycetota bacterium]
MKKLVIFLTIILAGMCSCITIQIPLPGEETYLDEIVVEEARGFWTRDRILILPVEGFIAGEESDAIVFKSHNTVSEVKQRLNMAAEDEHVKAVILRVNSPGGSVTASDTILNEIERFKKRTGKKVIAWFGSTAASGGYYISTSADKIVAHPTTITGSIGVIIQLTT